jgi:hypothetical protein
LNKTLVSTRLVDKIRTIGRRVVSYPFPVIISAWISLVFAERLVIDQFAWGRFASVSSSVFSTSVVVCFFFGWAAILAGMLVDRNSMARYSRFLKELLIRAIKEVFSPLTAILATIGLLIVILIQGATTPQSIYSTVVKWIAGLLRMVSGFVESPEARLLVIVVALYLISVLIYLFLKRRKKGIEDAISELIVSSFFVATFVVLYLWIYANLILSELHGEAQLQALAGLAKDTAVYSLVTIALVIGTFKAAETLRKLKKDINRWLVWGGMAFGTIAFMIPAIVLELSWKDNILRKGLAFEYREVWQQNLLTFHVMFRDYILLVPLIVAVFLRFMRLVERVNVESHKRRK